MVRVYKSSKCELLIEVPKFLKQYFVKHFMVRYLLDDTLLLQTQILLLKSDISTGYNTTASDYSSVNSSEVRIGNRS